MNGFYACAVMMGIGSALLGNRLKFGEKLGLYLVGVSILIAIMQAAK